MIAHRLFPALLIIGVAGGCSHQQPTKTAALPPALAKRLSGEANTRQILLTSTNGDGDGQDSPA